MFLKITTEVTTLPCDLGPLEYVKQNINCGNDKIPKITLLENYYTLLY